MTLSPPSTSVQFRTAGDSPNRVAASSLRHAHVSPETKAYIEQNNLGAAAVTKRASFRSRERGTQGSSSESLSSSSSDMGLKHAGGAKVRAKKSQQSSKLMHKGGAAERSEYMDANPQLLISDALGADDVSDSYFVYDPSGGGGGAHERLGGKSSAVAAAFSGAVLDKVLSPIRDDLLSTLQTVSPIKEEDNDQLFGPKPKSIDKETLDRLKGLKHEYVNVQFDKKRDQAVTDTADDVTTASTHQSCDVTLSVDDDSGVSSDHQAPDSGTDSPAGAATVTSAAVVASDTTTRSSMSPIQHSRVHDYMEIELHVPDSKASTAKDTKPSTVSDTNTTVTSVESKQSNSSRQSVAPSGGSVGNRASMVASREHEYHEIDFDTITTTIAGDGQAVTSSAIPDPFGELSPMQPMHDHTSSSTATTRTSKASSGPVRDTASSSTTKLNRSSLKKPPTHSHLLVHSDSRASSRTSPAGGATGGTSTKAALVLSSPIESSQQLVADLVRDVTTNVQQLNISSSDTVGTVARCDVTSVHDVSPPPVAIDVFNLGAKPREVTPRNAEPAADDAAARQGLVAACGGRCDAAAAGERWAFELNGGRRVAAAPL